MKIFIRVPLPSDHPFLINKYTQCYYAIIEAARQRPTITDYETHHIIPVSFFANHNRQSVARGWLAGEPNTESNLINLTYREHFICHWLLTRMVTGVAKIKMVRALKIMCFGKSKERNAKSSKHYALCRIAKLLHLKNSDSPRKNKKYGPQTKPFKGVRVSGNKGEKQSEQVKKAISDKLKGRPSPRKGIYGVPSPKRGKKYGLQSKPCAKLPCPYCSRLCASNNINRHIDKCKKSNMPMLLCS